jgi:hypothetical protein
MKRGDELIDLYEKPAPAVPTKTGIASVDRVFEDNARRRTANPQTLPVRG